jgi:predicted metal-binding protein
MTRIAILTCGNVKNELSCSAAGCFKSFNERDGEFSRYKGDEELQIVGLSSCAGCPTRLAPEKLLNKVKPLVEMGGAEKIHFSSCMLHLCPFINKYKTVIGPNTLRWNWSWAQTLLRKQSLTIWAAWPRSCW